MAKMVDITDRLSFDENPSLSIKGEKIEVNADAVTVLKVMGIFSSEKEPDAKEITDFYELLFPDKSKKKIEKLKLSFWDLMTVAQEAMKLVTGEEEEPGEQ